MSKGLRCVEKRRAVFKKTAWPNEISETKKNDIAIDTTVAVGIENDNRNKCAYDFGPVARTL